MFSNSFSHALILECFYACEFFWLSYSFDKSLSIFNVTIEILDPGTKDVFEAMLSQKIHWYFSHLFCIYEIVKPKLSKAHDCVDVWSLFHQQAQKLTINYPLLVQDFRNLIWVILNVSNNSFTKIFGQVLRFNFAFKFPFLSEGLSLFNLLFFNFYSFRTIIFIGFFMGFLQYPFFIQKFQMWIPHNFLH